MKISGEFIISVKGKASTRAAGHNIKLLLDQRVKLIDPGVELMERNFAGQNFLFEWTGIPLHIDKAQMLFGYLKKQMRNYFTDWKFIINIKLYESEVEENAESNF